MMEFELFKGLLGLLFFGAVFAFGFLQLASLRRSRSAVRIRHGSDGNRQIP